MNVRRFYDKTELSDMGKIPKFFVTGTSRK